MIVALLRALEGYTTLLEKIVLNDAPFYHPPIVEAHLHELAEPRRVVVPHSFGISCSTNKEKQSHESKTGKKENDVDLY